MIDWLFCRLALLIYCSLSLSFSDPSISTSTNKKNLHPSTHPSLRTFLRFFFSTLLAYNKIEKKKTLDNFDFIIEKIASKRYLQLLLAAV